MLTSLLVGRSRRDSSVGNVATRPEAKTGRTRRFGSSVRSKLTYRVLVGGYCLSLRCLLVGLARGWRRCAGV